MAKVYVSSVINASAAKVWAMVRDFNGLPKWTPFVASSEIEGGHPSDKIGCIRNFLLKDGGRIRETLLSLSDKDMSMTYDIIVSPMGVTNYLATLSVAPITMTGQAFVLWTAEFDAEEKREAELVEHIGANVFAAAFANLNTMMK